VVLYLYSLHTSSWRGTWLSTGEIYLLYLDTKDSHPSSLQNMYTYLLTVSKYPQGNEVGPMRPSVISESTDGRLERQLQMVQLSATRCSYIGIL